jgi:hypothetical protein
MLLMQASQKENLKIGIQNVCKIKLQKVTYVHTMAHTALEDCLLYYTLPITGCQ